MPRISKAIIGAGGVFHVASVFSMRGLIALPTIKNTAGYDIIVTSPDGLKHANIQVKTSSGRPGYWPICNDIANVKTSPNDFYVLLRRTKDNSSFEGFMLSGEEMKSDYPCQRISAQDLQSGVSQGAREAERRHF
jgi:hypothetical protein